jgi:hypothetical protein
MDVVQVIEDIKKKFIIFELKHCEFEQGVICEATSKFIMISSKKFGLGTGMYMSPRKNDNYSIWDTYLILQKSSDRFLDSVLSQTIGIFSIYYKNVVTKINIATMVFSATYEKTNVLYQFPNELIRYMKSFLL